jgi:rhamnose transport system permease protein
MREGSAAPPDAQAILAPASSPWRWAARLRETGLLVALALILGGTGMAAPNFLAPGNLALVATQAGILAVAAVGEAMVILTRNVDLSVDAIMGLVAFSVGDLFAWQHMAVPEAIALGVAMGMALGAINGLLVTVGGVPSIVATLGTMNIYRGLDFLLAGGNQISAANVPAAYLHLTTATFLGVPWVAIFAAAVVAGVAYALRYAPGGRWVYAVGSNPQGAQVLGIRPGRVVFFTFLVSGALAGAAGVLWGSWFGTINAYTADGMVLEVVAAAVVGGVNIFGGSGTVVGAALGALLLSTIENALIVLKLSQFWLQAIDGAVILAAVATDNTVLRFLRQGLGPVRLGAVRRAGE